MDCLLASYNDITLSCIKERYYTDGLRSLSIDWDSDPVKIPHSTPPVCRPCIASPRLIALDRHGYLFLLCIRKIIRAEVWGRPIRLILPWCNPENL